MSSGDTSGDDGAANGRWPWRHPRPLQALHRAFIRGLAVVVPVVLTLVVLGFVLEFAYARVDLVSDLLLGLGVGAVATELLIELLVPVAVLALVLAVGLLVDLTRFGQRLVDYFDYALTHVPGVGGVYEGFRKMSDTIVESDVQNFRDVKLVEFPQEDMYTMGFVTARTPESIRTAAGHDEMLTLFLPLAPNPVMGGHLVHVPEHRVVDVDLTIEEGMEAILTTGVALGGGDAAAAGAADGLSREQLSDLAASDPPAPDSPDAPDASGAPGAPGAPDAPDASDTSDTPDSPADNGSRDRSDRPDRDTSPREED